MKNKKGLKKEIKEEIKKILDNNYIEDSPDLILELFEKEKAKDRQEILEEIDRVYKKERGIHNWLDLRENLSRNQRPNN